MNAPLLKTLIDSNPGLQTRPMPAPTPGGSVTTMPAARAIDLVRAQAPGGELMGYIQSPEVQYFEVLYRTLPPKGMYLARPNKPVQFVLGAFKVPQSQVLVVLDYSFDIYRFSGATPGDFVPIEENRLSTQIGWDITVEQNRPAQLSFQLVPAAQSQNQQQFPNSNLLSEAQQYQFDAARAAQNQSVAGPALSMMPQRRHRNGLVHVSNNYVARSSQVLSASCSVFNFVPIPIGFFEANLMGLIIPQNLFDNYLKQQTPTGPADVPRLPVAGQ